MVARDGCRGLSPCRALHLRRLLTVFALLCACHKPEPVPECTEGLRASPLRLLTRFEVDNTLSDLVKDNTRAGQGLPAEPLALGLDNNGDVLKVTSDFQSRLLDVAETVAHRAVTEHKSELLPCTTADAACGQKFIEAFGRRAFRRPLTAAESATFGDLFAAGLMNDGFDAAVEWTVTAFIMSPQFLYRLEAFSGDGKVEAVDAYALASRVSYFVWGTMPDEPLLASAESGKLLESNELEAQVDRMLKDARAQSMPGHFYSLWLDLDAVVSVEKSAAVYPDFKPSVRASWRQSMEMYVGDVFSKSHTLESLLTSSVLYVDQEMGGMYGNGPVPAGAFVRLEMPTDRRAGLVTQPGFLARLSSPDQSSPVRRGVFVLDKVMCESIAPPPPTVLAVPPPIDPTHTTRERFAIHAETAGCSGCHIRMDGIGFGFEHYDGIGAYRTTDNGKPVDATGEVVQANETALDGPFDGAPALMSRLGKARQVHDCATTQWYRYALGRVETEADACSITSVQTEFFEHGGDFDALRRAIAKSASFRYHAQEVQP